MKMLKYRNKRIFIGLSLAVLFLIVTSFVASSLGDQGKDKIKVTLSQDPMSPVTKGTLINFTWVVTQPGSYYYPGEYCFMIERKRAPPEEAIVIEERDTISDTDDFLDSYEWTVPPDAEGEYTASIRVPCENSKIGAYTKFTVETTVLVIQKFHDTNPNEQIDEKDERPLNWKINVINPDGVPSTIPTDDNGEVRINVQEEYVGKDYKIEEIRRPDWKLIKKDTNAPIVGEGKQWIKITVEKGKESNVTFLNTKVTTILIQKFEDTNQNYEIDSGDKKLPNWEFNVTNPAGETKSYKTDIDGKMLIDIPGKEVGDYKIAEIIKKPDESKLIEIDTNKTAPILDQGKQWIKIRVEKGKQSEVRFLNTDQTELVISKFYDHNLNGKRNAVDEGLGNWEFKIKFPDGSVKNVPTEPDGRYIIDNPPTGKYTISEQPQPCWKNSTPMVRDVEITPDQGEEVEFGNYEMGNLTIYKFNDTDRNGVWDAGEVPLPNREFKVKGPNGVIDITRYTDDKGSQIVELPANFRYSVSETIPVGWRNSTPHTQSVYINPCEDTAAIFGNYRYTPINIHKFNDTNGNGIRDSDEAGLAGWDFRIYGPNVNKIFTTDENGRVRYEDAIPGQYRIEERPRKDQLNDWRSTTTLIREITVEDRPPKTEEFGNQYIIKGNLCEEYGLYDEPSIEPEWYPMSDGYLNVSKHLEPHIVHCDSPNLQKGEIINVTLRVCAFAGMSPTDLVLAIDTSGSLIERGGVVLEVIRDGIIAFMETNKDKFGETGRVGLVSWDEDIDETVNLTTDYSKVTTACRRLSSNAEEDTLYQVGLNGSIKVFAKSPRGNAKKVIVFITDAKGTTDGLSSFSELLDTSGCVIHAITVGTERDNGTVKMLENFTSQHSGFVKSVPESSDELAKQLTTLTVTNIERRTLNNVTVIETLPKYLRALNKSYTELPTSVQINQDGIYWSTETILWDIGDLSSDNCWESTFKALFCCQMPADVSHPIGIPNNTSEVRYTDPTNSSITRHLPIPEGIIWIRAGQQPQISGFDALLAIAALFAVAFLMWYRRR